MIKPVHFAVLLSLRGEARHGFGIMEHVNQQLDGGAIVGPGTLYRLLKEMREQEVIERVDPPADQNSDERRQYHRLTSLGLQVVVAESARLRKVLSAAEASELVPEGGPQ